MCQDTNCQWISLSPPFISSTEAREAFQSYATGLENCFCTEEFDDNRLSNLSKDYLKKASSLDKSLEVSAAIHLLTDLVRQKWKIKVDKEGVVHICQPTSGTVSLMAEKTRIREQELVKRNEQLRQPSTQKFIKYMERKRVHGDQFVSIFSLMRDGRELAEALRSTRTLDGEQRLLALNKVVSPYLQFVSEDAVCVHTGLKLQDIWRYFRHTWSNQYTTTPGRSMSFIVRDSAAPFHPVIGIGGLSSSIVQIRERDDWIGWQFESFWEDVNENPPVDLGVWLVRIVEKAINDVYTSDFHEEIYEGKVLLEPKALRQSSREDISRLKLYGENQRQLHYRLTNSGELKRSKSKKSNESVNWEERAKTHLFRSKRALLLAEMLESKLVLKRFLSQAPSTVEVKALISDREGKHAIKKILRKAKADRVGIAMADISVCGAIPPYNPILGGKLVSMLAASPEVVEAYTNKYFNAESEIASSIAGRPIIRPSALVYLGTTSLYGVGSSQYNRVRTPAKVVNGRVEDEIRYIELGKSQAFGTSQFSEGTVKALVSLVQQSHNGQKVNSIFGEGVSPKLRKIRDGMGVLNLPIEMLLKHGRHRIVYGVPLIRNLREYLLGMDDEPDFIFAIGGKESTSRISKWWIERWLQRRIENDEVIENIDSHTLVFPIKHGARVTLPRRRDESRQLPLFDDLD